LWPADTPSIVTNGVPPGVIVRSGAPERALRRDNALNTLALKRLTWFARVAGHPVRMGVAAIVIGLGMTAPAFSQGAGQGAKPAEPAVAAANAAILSRLPFQDRTDFEDAERGFIATIPDALVTGPAGRVVWSLKDYAFLDKDRAPDTVNPSLWRQAQLNRRHGLFKIVEGLYQVRELDGSNMTLIEGRTGVIVVDPLLSVETAKAGLDLYFQHRPRRPVVAVIHTHGHADHFGGVKGVVNEADVAAGKVAVIAPEGFTEHAVTENVIAGNAMRRRAQFQFGVLLPKGERGQVDAGLGKTISLGTLSLIPPTDLIKDPRETRTVDGVEIVFVTTPNAEAPAEFYMYFPALRVLDMAELATHNFHNLLPFRGAEVRDALAWSKYIDGALAAFGDKSDVVIAQHQWPVFGGDRGRHFLRKQRNLYKYVHDQTLRLINQGFTADEIAEQLELPPSLANEWANRGYYGSVRHNVKAIYQRYLGWYDGNPAHLDPLPPVEGAKKYVAYMGGADAVLRRAKDDFKKGDYRFVAELANKVVFADPDNREARDLAADAYEQLGYLAESATWRNAYLYAAYELRHGPSRAGRTNALNPETVAAIPTATMFDYFGIQLNGPKADGRRVVINWTFTDTRETFVTTLEDATLTTTPNTHAEDADASLTLARDTLDAVAVRRTGIDEAIRTGRITVAGDAAKVADLFALMDVFDPNFEVVEPKRAVR
jgi:alkyl sulfatase BDS1-like metallo-beta-lactamase superfamily hydrolase